MRTLLRQLFTIGIGQEQSFSEKRDIIYTNEAVFVLIASSLIIGLVDILSGLMARAFIPFTIVLFLPLIFVAQYYRHYSLARISTVLLPLTGPVLSGVLFGLMANPHAYIVASFALSLILFHCIKHQLILLLFHAALLVSLKLYSLNYPPVFSGLDSVAIGYFNLCFSMLDIWFALSQFTIHNKNYEAKINALMLEKQEQAFNLEKQKEVIEKQAVAMQKTNQGLKEEINRRATMQKKIMSSNEELEQFAYVASHDLKEPLRTVGSFTQLIYKKHKDDFDKTSLEYLDFVVEAVKRMSGLLDDLLAFSKLNQHFEHNFFDLQDTLTLVCHNLSSLIAQTNGKVVFHNMPSVFGNQNQFLELFQNLISNSLKFRGELAPIVVISCEKHSGFFHFKVTDNGIGISKEYNERIFIIFQRLHHRHDYEGSGIGLAVCRKIVQNHGGKIWVESKEREGACFFFTIRDLEGNINEKKPKEKK